ncbi:MAG TPA: hypothetical protein VEK79_18785 [Thermoanaerobaculia bacterium]|nr:hypothetical protein [Thermoanaerobaculia bacterium]
MKLVSIWTFLILVALNTFFNVFLFKPRVKSYPAKTFDGRIKGFRPSEAKGILKQFKDAGKLDAYLEQEWKIDLIYPLIYTAMFAVAILGLGAPRWMVLLPLIGMVGDYVENFSVIGMIVQYRDHGTVPYPLAVLASVGSRVKWSFTLASAAVVLALGVWWLIRVVRR